MRPAVVVSAAVALLAPMVCASCGSSSHGNSPVSPSPTSPSAVALPFRAGVYVFNLSGADFVVIGSGPLIPGCTGIAMAGIQPVTTEIAMTFEGNEWHGRPLSSAGGSFDIRFVEGAVGPGAPGGGPGVVGTVAGVVVNTISFVPNLPVFDSRANLGNGALGPTATLNGGTSSDGHIASGLASGDVNFSNSTGTTVACNSGTVSWFVSTAAQQLNPQ